MQWRTCSVQEDKCADEGLKKLASPLLEESGLKLARGTIRLKLCLLLCLLHGPQRLAVHL